ncbi:hypothetical protein IJ732_05130 [bacterium]|nr:hypothetical protein [bacterium]
MRNIKLIITAFVLILGSQAFCANVWLNDLRNVYSNKQAIIYELNIRTFNAEDKDGNGVITKGEERGNFVNATKRLNELSQAGINTVKIMPVLPVSKTQAFGTAGSLFAPVEFNKIDPTLKSPRGTSAYEEMKRFINECHKRKIRVIAALPCCAGYDLYKKNPALFLKDGYGNPIAPEGMDDVRILNAGTENNINNAVYQLYRDFTEMMVDLSVDGISVSMPETKPASFWKKLINETRKFDSQMLFLAEVNPDSNKIFKEYLTITPTSKLLEAGFDGYSGNYNKIEDVKKDLYNYIKSDMSISQKFDNKKSVYGNFSSYDNENPIINNGADYVRQLIWFGATMPANMHYLDGYTTGDNYMYPMANKKAAASMTDDMYYHVKRGQIDIYNYSRRPAGMDFNIYTDFVTANRFRLMASEVIAKGNFITFKTSNPNVLGYGRSFNNITVVVIANTAKTEFEKIKIKIPKINSEFYSVPIKVSANIPTLEKGGIITNMAPLEIQVLMFQNFNAK